MKKLFIILAIICGIIPTIFYTFMIVENVNFDKNCTQYLKLSTNANSVEISEERLTTALNYIEEHNLTSGDCKFWIANQPKNNLEIWYTNLKAAQKQLIEIKNNELATELEKSNILMKLRETLYDDEHIIIPTSIEFYPDKTLILTIAVFAWILYIGTIIFIINACACY